MKKNRRGEGRELEVLGRRYPRFWEDFLNTAIVFLLIAAVALLILMFVGRVAVVNGESMQPNLHDGDLLIVQKLGYRNPQRFDIVVFDSGDERGTLYIKRVMGLPGETVQVADGAIWINGQKLEEDYGLEPMDSAGIAAEPLTLGENEYFVLGDNRNNSGDSRSASVGPVHRDQIVGKALLRFWPVNEIGLLRHQ